MYTLNSVHPNTYSWFLKFIFTRIKEKGYKNTVARKFNKPQSFPGFFQSSFYGREQDFSQIIAPAIHPSIHGEGGLHVEAPDNMRDISITNSKLTLSLSFLRDWRADGLPTALYNGHKYLLKPQACNNWCQCLLGVKQIDNKNKKEKKL